MNNNTQMWDNTAAPTRRTTALTDTELLIILAAVFAPVVGSFILGLVPDVQGWLIDYQVLTAPEESLLLLPGGIAGVDLVRVILVGLVLAAGVALAVLTAGRRRRRQLELAAGAP